MKNSQTLFSKLHFAAWVLFQSRLLLTISHYASLCLSLSLSLSTTLSRFIFSLFPNQTAKRIKADLISKAKIKKGYYKSIGQDRNSTSTSFRGQKSQSVKNDPFFQEQEDQDQDNDHDDDDEEGENEIESEPRRSSKSTKGKERARDEIQSTDNGFSGFLKGKEKDYGKFGIYNQDQDEDLLDMKPKGERKRLKRLEKEKEKKKDQSSSSTPTFNRPNSKNKPSTSNKPLKEEKKSMTREESLKIRENRSEKWNSISKSYKGRKRGQPDLGNRMEVLLDRIRESA